MIMSERDVFAGAHVTQEVKAALRALAGRRTMSMSAIIYEAIKEKLAREGVEIEAEKEPSGVKDVPLPYDAH